MNKFKISRSLCKIIPGNEYHSELLSVQLPSESQYFGYEVSLYCYEDENLFFEAYRPRGKNWSFELIKSEREKGKRYKRYRLTWDELIKEFEQHQKQFDKSECRKGLAYVYDYDYRGRVEQERVGKYVVGAVDGKWFWINEYERRRISAKNFRLIAILSASEIEAVENCIEKLKQSEMDLEYLTRFNGIRGKVQGLFLDFTHIQFNEKLNKNLNELLSSIDELIADCKANIARITEKFEGYHSEAQK